MAVPIGAIEKAAATVLSNEKLRKGVGWILAAVFSPLILIIAFLLCSIGTGGADHNNQAVAATFYPTEQLLYGSPDRVPVSHRGDAHCVFPSGFGGRPVCQQPDGQRQQP
jgi:hypothetical protein